MNNAATTETATAAWVLILNKKGTTYYVGEDDWTGKVIPGTRTEAMEFGSRSDAESIRDRLVILHNCWSQMRSRKEAVGVNPHPFIQIRNGEKA